jgi:hypothetical protein
MLALCRLGPLVKLSAGKVVVKLSAGKVVVKPFLKRFVGLRDVHSINESIKKGNNIKK